MKMTNKRTTYYHNRKRYQLHTDVDVIYECDSLRRLYRYGLTGEIECEHICKLYSVLPDGTAYFIGAFEDGHYFTDTAWIATGGSAEPFFR